MATPIEQERVREKPAGAPAALNRNGMKRRRAQEADMTKATLRIIRWSCAAGTFWLAPAIARAQAPAPPPGQPAVCQRRGPIHRLFHHSAHTLQDTMIGYPQTFIEPPLGYYVNEQFTVQVAKADLHRFTLYRSDFLPGTTAFSPAGASRFNIMRTRVAGWVGPIIVEWMPEQPALAQAQRAAVLASLNEAGIPIAGERVVIAPSAYPGGRGIEAVDNNTNTIMRHQLSATPTAYQLPPAESAAMGVR